MARRHTNLWIGGLLGLFALAVIGISGSAALMYWSKQRPYRPDFGGGTVVESLEIDQLKIDVMRGMNSPGDIHYRYIALVKIPELRRPAFYVASESSKLTDNEDGNFLGVFDGPEYLRFGPSQDWNRYDLFRDGALALIEDRFGVEFGMEEFTYSPPAFDAPASHTMPLRDGGLWASVDFPLKVMVISFWTVWGGLALAVIIGFFKDHETAGSELVRAVMKGNKARIEKAFKQKHDWNVPLTAKGGIIRFALIEAIVAREELMARRMVQSGANPNVRDDRGWTPIGQAMMRGESLELIEDMLIAGGDPDFETFEGRPLTVAVQQVIEGRRQITLPEYLLTRGASIDYMEPDHIVAPHGGSALMLACRAGRTDLTHLLLSQRADPNLWNYNDEGPVHEAAASGNAEVLKLLVASGAEPHVPTLRGETPLMCSARAGDIAGVSFLLDLGVDRQARNEGDQTAADVAREAGHNAIADLIEGTDNKDP